MDVNELQFANSGDGKDIALETNERLIKFQNWFKDAVDASHEWREAAKEDYDFYNGRQWDADDRRNLEEHHRPVITINRIKPLMNVLSGYQRLNRYDINFLPRTNDDMKQAQLRKGVTKYVMDASHYNYEESDVFIDSAVAGLGWFEVGYKFDWSTMEGDAFIRRVSALDMYVDPESRDKYFRDAKFVIRARWIDKEELKNRYPERKDEIEAQSSYYLAQEAEADLNRKLWWQEETKKIRIAECWYKKAIRKKVFILRTGESVAEVTPDMVALQMIAEVKEFVAEEVHLMVFFDNVVLEDMSSPYEHGYLPFVPFPCYYNGDDDIPAGIVRDLKDAQREVNKRRSQQLHILNTTANGSWLVEDGAMTRQQEQDFKRLSTTAGSMLKVNAGTLGAGKIQPFNSVGVNASFINATQEAEQEMVQISGINEALMGTDIRADASGRAIELKQKQAITHIALLFDNLRYAKERIVKLLWGRRGAAGIIPQYYTEEKTFRIIGENGKPEFATVNQQVQEMTPDAQLITVTLNDLSIGEYDIVISDTPATATQRTAQFWSLVDACGQLGLQGPDIMEILIDLSDIAQKDEIKEKLKARQEQEQAQQQMLQQLEQQKFQAQLELEREKKLSKSIAYKDLQLPLQLQLAAKAGIFPQEYADAFLKWSTDQIAAQMGMGGSPLQTLPQAPQTVPQVPTPPVPPVMQAPQQPRPMTDAARQGVMEANQGAI